MTIAINLFGGPGSGKSTTAAGLFYELKTMGINCELITEFAKDKVWEDSLGVLDNQIYVFGQQSHRQFRVKDKVDVLITDSPIPLNLYYGSDLSDNFKNLVLEVFDEYDNLNYLIERGNDYQYRESGRMQAEKEAIDIHLSIKKVLKKHNIKYKTIYRQEVNKDNNMNLMIKDILEKIL